MGRCDDERGFPQSVEAKACQRAGSGHVYVLMHIEGAERTTSRRNKQFALEQKLLSTTGVMIVKAKKKQNKKGNRATVQRFH